MKNINEKKGWFFENTNKIEYTLANWSRKKEKTQFTNIRNETWDTTIHLVDIKRVIREYCKQVYTHKFDNLDKMDPFTEKQKLSKFTYYEIDLAQK